MVKADNQMPKAGRTSNPLALAVLALLFERPMHPYEMAATLKERHKEIYEHLEAAWLAWNAAMLPEIDESFTHSFSGAELADHIGTPEATGKADHPKPQAGSAADPH